MQEGSPEGLREAERQIMNDLKTRYFFGDTLEQAVMRAASHFQIHPDEVAYTRVEKRHGFLRLRRRVVIEVDPDRPKRPAGREPDPMQTSTLPVPEKPRRRRRGGGSGRSRPQQQQAEPQRQPRDTKPRRRRRGGRARSHAGPPRQPRGGERSAGGRRPADTGGLVELPDAPKRASERYPTAEGPAADAARQAVDQLLGFAGLEMEAAVLQGDDRLEIELWGAEQKQLLAQHGQLLLAIQHLLPRLIRDDTGEGVPCRVDCDNFHEIREEQLRDLAQRAASEVARRGRPKTLAPMRPSERRIVHMALADDPQVTTESQGRGLFKRVQVRPSGDAR